MAKYKCIVVTRLPSAQCTVLYCTVQVYSCHQAAQGPLYCTVLYCTVLYYTVLYCTVPYKCIVVTRLPTVLSSAGAPDLYLLIYKTFYFFALMTISRTLQAEM